MTEQVEIKGIWKGEYVYDDKLQPSIVKPSTSFILKIKSIDEKGLFEGMCQDDPVASDINLSAEIYGVIKNNELFFVKKYSKTIIRDVFGNVTIVDGPHPDIVYSGKLNHKDQFFGAWSVERTFRKLNNNILEFPPINGLWWMKRF
jgi:hypothetical protein